MSETWYVVDRTFDYIGKLLTGRESADQLSGPIRIAQVSGQVANLGGVPGLIGLVAVLSVSIGLINLFPIPLLDGGHLLFYAIEAVRGRPLSDRAQEIGFRIGFAIVAMLMLFATWNDIVHVGTSIHGPGDVTGRTRGAKMPRTAVKLRLQRCLNFVQAVRTDKVGPKVPICGARPAQMQRLRDGPIDDVDDPDAPA